SSGDHPVVTAKASVMTGYSQVVTASTLPPMSSAIRAARRSAASDGWDPSTPTTMRPESAAVVSLMLRRYADRVADGSPSPGARRNARPGPRAPARSAESSEQSLDATQRRRPPEQLHRLEERRAHPASRDRRPQRRECD